MNIGRIIGSIIFLDFRHALCINVLFTGRALHLIGDWMAVGPTAVQEVCAPWPQRLRSTYCSIH